MFFNSPVSSFSKTSIPAISFKAFAVLFNSNVPLLALALIPARLIAIVFKPFPTLLLSCNVVFALAIIATVSSIDTPYSAKTLAPEVIAVNIPSDDIAKLLPT